jgi:hypothetical protein
MRLAAVSSGSTGSALLTNPRGPVDTRTYAVRAGSYRAALQVSTVDGHRYVDKSWRVG